MLNIEQNEGPSALSSPLLADEPVHAEFNTNMERSDALGQDEDAISSIPLPTTRSSELFFSFCIKGNSAQVMAMISNFSTSYNVVNISLVLPILETTYKVSEEQSATCASSLLAGMVVGQLVGGALGDSFLGREGALRVVMAFQIVSSFASALIYGPSLLTWLAFWRFALGIGAGGVYPLAAVLSAEQGDDEQRRGRHHALKIEDETPQERMQQLRRVVLTFSMQGIGFLAVPLLTVPLLYMTDKVNLVWRLLLAFGCLPGIVMVALQFVMYKARDDVHGRDAVPQEEPSDDDAEADASEAGTASGALVHEGDREEYQEDAATDGESPSSSLWDSVKHEPNVGQKLLGTAGTWFLFDVLFYGNTLFEPIVMEAAFGGGNGAIKKVATDSLLLACIALPGYIISAFVMGRRLCYVTQTPKYVQMQGFVAMSFLYAIVGAYWTYLKRIPWLLVLLYGSTFFFANFGPNTTTFVFPSLVYSPECRSTLNGISAAAGKAGALLGATMFEPVSDMLGDDRTMLICAGVSVLAFAITRFFVRLPPVGQEISPSS